MKYLKKFESIEEIHDSLSNFKMAISFISDYNELETYEMNKVIDELINSSKDEIREIYDSLVENKFTLEIIRKYCQEIWY